MGCAWLPRRAKMPFAFVLQVRLPMPARPAPSPHAAAPPKTAKAKSRIAQENELKILDAAQEVFAEYGLHGATMDRIAAGAGLSKPNLHYYFAAKIDLYVAVLHRTLRIWESTLTKLDPLGDPAEELSRYIIEKVEMSRLHPLASRVFASEILRGAPALHHYLSTELRELVETKAKVIRGWIAQGKLACVDPHHLIFLIWSATQHYADFLPQVLAVTGKARFQAKDFQAVEQSLTQILLRGLLVRAD